MSSMPLAADSRTAPRGAFNAKLWIGGAIILVAVIVAIWAPELARHDPLEQDLLNATQPPAWMPGGDPAFIFGTDSLGRDIFSRLLFGTRIALTVAVMAAVLAGLIGSVLGLIAGFFGGMFDTVISRLIDMWMAFPPVLLAIVLVAVFGTGIGSVVTAIVIVDWTRFCRVVRAEVLVQSKRDYVASAVMLGMSPMQILIREIVPNIWPLLIDLLTLEMGIAVIVEAILSFVGLSIGSDTPTWGSMIQEGRQYINQVYWLLVFPVACVGLLVLAFNWFGDGLRAFLDPAARR